jgi:hypothetical protein
MNRYPKKGPAHVEIYFDIEVARRIMALYPEGHPERAKIKQQIEEAERMRGKS